MDVAKKEKGSPWVTCLMIVGSILNYVGTHFRYVGCLFHCSILHIDFLLAISLERLFVEGANQTCMLCCAFV